MSNLLEKAINLACSVHAGQVDKAGKPYILHPLRLMLSCDNDEEMIVSVLHDVVEDGNVKLVELLEQGFSQPIVAAIDCLTRRNNETYEEFIDRIKVNALARKVKVKDIRDNMDLTRLVTVTDKDLSRASKYHKALKQLTEG